MDNNKYLQHHGVKGMKWGVRRNLSKLDNKKIGSKKTEDSKNLKQKVNQTAPKSKQRSIKEMSDDEIRSKINRLTLEKDYKRLLSETSGQKQVSKGRAFVMDVLERSGKNIATQATTYAMGKAVNRVFESIYGEPEAINPKKGQKDK